MSHQLSKNIDMLGFATGSTGSTSINVEVDSANFEGVMFVGVSGTTSTAATLTVSSAATSTGSFVNVSGGTAASTGIASRVVVDIHKPRKAFLKGTLTSTATARLDLTAYGYGPRKCPVTWTSTGILTALVSPDS